jgi:protoporphyrinogen oxidase
VTGERKFIVLGAGPAGLTAAYELVKQGVQPLVIEKLHLVGGLARTETYKGYYFDMGGHRFFTKIAEVNNIWHEVLAENFLKRRRLSRIFYKRKFFNYPLKPLNALIGLGMVDSILILCSYVRWKLFPYPEEATFEQWVTNRFGKRLFLTFFKTYTEKVWGIPCSELKAEWAAQRIKDLSLKTALMSMFFKPKKIIKTLIDQFDYPRQGPGMMWKMVQERVNERGGNVRTGCDLVKIQRQNGRVDKIVIRSESGKEEVISGTDFISSIPIREFIKKLDPPPPENVLFAAQQLKYRDFLTVCLIINRESLFPDNWIYIHDPNVHVGRIQNFKNWSPDMVPDPRKTSLGLEYFCNEGDQLWNMQDEELIKMASLEVERIGLARACEVEDGCVVRVPKSYPIYTGEYAAHLRVLHEYVDSLKNFQTIGRNGLHRYNNQDHAMLTGIYAVQNALLSQKHDLWNVNADQEYHEEIAAIEMGLAEALRRFDRVAFGAGLGAVCGLGLFLMTIFLVLKGGSNVGANLVLLGQFFPGYKVTLFGSLSGLLYGSIVGFTTGWCMALFRNTAMFLYFSIIRKRVERGFMTDLFDWI